LEKGLDGMLVEVLHKKKKIEIIKTHKLKSYKGEIRFKLVSANDTYTFSYATKGKRYKVLTTTT